MADENGKPGDTPPKEDAAIPEVEAEIVDNETASSSAFDDDSDVGEGVLKDPPQKSKSLTPGVILFIVFAVIALLAFGFWRMQPGAPQSTATQQGEAASVEQREEGALSLPADDAKKEEQAPLAPEAEEELAPTPAINAPALQKIENKAAADLKEALDDIDPALDAAGDEVFLPPLGSGDPPANVGQDFRQTAKDRLQQPDSPESRNEIEGFEITPSDQNQAHAGDEDPATAESEEQEQAGIAGVEGELILPTEEENNLSIASVPGGKIANEVKILKQTFRLETERLATELDEERDRRAALSDEIAALRRDLQAALAATDAQTGEAMSNLQARLDKIENEAPAPSAKKQIAGVFALNALTRAVDQGGSYAAELSTLTEILPGAPALAILQKHSETGVATKADLKKRFGPAARDALAAAGQEKANGFFGNLSARAKSVISIRPAEPMAGDSPRAIISRAENAVETGNFTLALTHLADLPASGREAMVGWIAAAQARAEAAAAIDDLNNLLAVQSPG